MCSTLIYSFYSTLDAFFQKLVIDSLPFLSSQSLRTFSSAARVPMPSWSWLTLVSRKSSRLRLKNSSTALEAVDTWVPYLSSLPPASVPHSFLQLPRFSSVLPSEAGWEATTSQWICGHRASFYTSCIYYCFKSHLALCWPLLIYRSCCAVYVVSFHSLAKTSRESVTLSAEQTTVLAVWCLLLMFKWELRTDNQGHRPCVAKGFWLCKRPHQETAGCWSRPTIYCKCTYTLFVINGS